MALGTEPGFFTTATSFAAGTNPISIVTVDFNGDGKLDIAMANSGSNNVRVMPGNGSGGFSLGVGSGIFAVGLSPNSLVVGEFNGNSEPDVATSNSSSNNLSVLLNSCEVAKGSRVDFDADRRTDLAVFRPSNGRWYILLSSTNNTIFNEQLLGSAEHKIVPEDYNGDGVTDLAYFHPGTGTWVVPGIYFLEFGISTDTPGPADYDGDGRADLAVFRPSDGIWYIQRSSDNSVTGISWGVSTDIPGPGDCDSDGKFDVAVWRPSNGYWYVRRSSDGALLAQPWGTNGDIPLPSVYVP